VEDRAMRVCVQFNDFFPTHYSALKKASQAFQAIKVTETNIKKINFKTQSELKIESKIFLKHLL